MAATGAIGLAQARQTAGHPPFPASEIIMRIAYFTETFLPKIDGIVNTLCYLLEYLARQGHASILFAPGEGSTSYANTSIVRLSGFSFPLYPELSLVPPYVNIDARLDAFQPDLIHLVNPVSLGLVGLRYARSRSIPLVASYHTDIPGFAVRWGLGILENSLWAYLRWIHNQADLNLCPSRVTRTQLTAQGIRRVKVWGRGVDTKRFDPHHRRADWRARLSGDQPEAPLLIYTGRLSPEKRVDWLRAVVTALPQVRLAIIGDGPSRSDLEHQMADTPTVFTGYLRGDDLARAYAAADIFLFPAANETLGNVVLEAMASGLPVVAPAAGGVLDHVVDRVTGLLVNPASPTEFVQAAASLVAQPAWARQLGRTGRLRVERQTWSHVFDGLLADYETLLATRQPVRSLRQYAP